MGPLGRAFSDLAAQVVALGGTRLELLGLEARDAGDRLLRRLAALLAAAVFLTLALLVATLALALIFWPTEYRTWPLVCWRCCMRRWARVWPPG